MAINFDRLKQLKREREEATKIDVATKLNEAKQHIIESRKEPHQPVTIPADEIPTMPMHGRVHDALAMEKLVDSDFPFDESQIKAIDGLASADFGCLTGAAGTGKTTCLKAIIDRVVDRVGGVDMGSYFATDGKSPIVGVVPSVALVAFTGRATQMIKRNFPHGWHKNIMTIHRLLHHVPEYYEDLNENDEIVNKLRFVPTYTADNPMPWDHIIIDEAGMLGIDLWEKLYAAMKKGCRVTMVGDINQLPPVHGSSIFGYAMIKWPAYELTHVHRQKGGNVIVDNAWRILQGKPPQVGPGFNMVKCSEISQVASKQLRHAMLQLTEHGAYDPIRDTAIVAINGKEGQKGAAIGQGPLNEYMAIQFNPDGQRYLIDAGRERKGFAIGDKVMVTKNDHERGLTNGMTGVVKEVSANGNYMGDMDCGPIEEIQARMREDKTEFDLHEMLGELSAGQIKNDEKGFNRGHASHIVEVEFEHGIFSFTTFAEVASLQLAYVITCHKSQGGEYPMVIILLHDANKSMLYREWLYTAVTRASERVLLVYNDNAIAGALRKQKIKGATLKEKAKKFIALAKSPLKAAPELPG